MKYLIRFIKRLDFYSASLLLFVLIGAFLSVFIWKCAFFAVCFTALSVLFLIIINTDIFGE